MSSHVSAARNLIECIVSTRSWGDSDMCVLDVGASGGIDWRWSMFGDRLTAVGFDPLIAEIDRLKAIETRPKVRYEAAFVVWRDYDRFFPPSLRNNRIASRFNQPFERSSAVAAHRIMQRDYVQDVFNSGAPVDYSSRTTTLDEFLASSPDLRPDFLKIDTDGGDYQVLLGATRLVESADLLGLSIECQFHGAVHEFANTFSNIDRFLRARGFSLFDLAPYKYSRESLPAPFAIPMAAQTISGQVNWGEALYFRDLGHPLYETQFGIAPTPERLLKLCCLFEMYELQDCAAEILATAEALRALPERAALLDSLTPNVFGQLPYDEYLARFNAAPLDWLPQNIERCRSERTAEPAGTPQGAQPHSPSGDHAEIEKLRATVSTLKQRVQSLKDEKSQLRERLRQQKRLTREKDSRPTTVSGTEA